MLLPPQIRIESKKVHTTLQFQGTSEAGKLMQLSSMQATRDSHKITTEYRLHIYDRDIPLKLLVDSGSVVSVLPYKYGGRHLTLGSLKLFAANASEIKTYGEKILDLNIGLRRNFK